MSRKIEKAIQTHAYDHLYEVLNKALRCEGTTKGTKPSDFELERVKAYIKERIIEHLRTEGSTPIVLFKIAEFFSSDFILSLKMPVSNYLSGAKGADFTNYLSEKYKGPGTLKEIYEHIEAEIEKVTERYYTLPKEWNIDLKILTLFLVILRQKIEESFSIFRPQGDEGLSEGIRESIRFEKKIKPFLVTKKCCATQISFTSDNVIANETHECRHEKMISSLFIPYVGDFTLYNLSKLGISEYNHSETRLGIVNHYLIFFKEVEGLLSIVTYFNSQLASESLVQSVDEILSSLLRKLKPSPFLSQGVIIMNTILFIQDTFQDLLEKLESPVFQSIKSFSILSKLEKQQNARIEKILSINLPQIPHSGSFLEPVKSFFETNIFFSTEVAEEVRVMLIEASMSLIFGRISELKMSGRRAEELLMDIGDLERFLKERSPRIPHIKLIKEYLQVFVCPTDDKEKFVENFLLLAGEKFNFYQILKVMENQEDIAEYFMLYKKMKKTFR